MAIVERIASTTVPSVQFFSFIEYISVATQKKGVGSRSNESES